MARKKQQLINYHTGSKTNMPSVNDVKFGEIVVRHHSEAPELLIKVSSGTTGDETTYGEWFAPFIASGQVANAIAAAVATLDGTISSDIEGLENALNAVSATVTDNYALSAITHEEIESARGSVSGYTDEQIRSLSAAVESAITVAIDGVTAGELTGLESRISALEEFSGKVETDYATSADTVAAIEAAKENAILTSEIASSAYTDSKFNELSGITSAYVASQLTGITGDISNLQSRVGDLETFSGYVETNYATKEFVGAASGYAYNTAKSEVIGTTADTKDSDTVYGAKKYADDKVKTLSGDVVTAISAEATRAGNIEESLQNQVNYVSGVVASLSGDMETYIDERLVTVYKYQGTAATVADLDNFTPSNGDVYNVVAANGNPGDANYTPAGTNYAWVVDDESTGDGHWDALGGSVDLSGFATADNLNSAVTRITNLESALDTTNTNVNAVSGYVETLSGSVVTKYATSADTEAAIEKAKTEAEIASSAYTDTQIQMLSGLTSAYVATEIGKVNSDLSNYALSSITDNQIKTAYAEGVDSAVTAVVGADVTTSANPTTITGLRLYSDEKDRELEERLQANIDAASGDANTRLTQLESFKSDITTSAATWNEKAGSAIQGARFGEVGEVEATYDTFSGGDNEGGTYASNAKMYYSEGEDVVIDLSELIIDCGDF